MIRLHRARRRLFALLALLLALAFAATTLLSFHVARESIRHRIIDSELPLTGDAIYAEIQHDLVKPVYVADQMAHNTFLLDWIASDEHDEAAVVRYLSEIQSRYGALTAFYISARTHIYFNADGRQRTVSEADDPWFFRVRDMGEPYEINIDRDARVSSHVVAFINYRVLSADGEFLGVTGIGLSSTAVQQLVAQYRLRFQRDVIFFDAQGRNALREPGLPDDTSTIHALPGLSTIASQVLNGSTAPTRLAYTSPGSGALTHVTSRYIPELKWYLVVGIDEANALAEVRRVLWLNIAIGVLATLGALGLTLWLVSRHHARLSRLAATDPLTGLANRAAVDERLGLLREAALAGHSGFAMLLLDVDHFKRVNDSHGHAVGDRMLTHVARTLLGQVRDSDVVARWGGEEFLVLLPDATLEAAQSKAEAMRAAVAAQAIEVGQGQLLGCTLSVGVAAWAMPESGEQLFGRADAALAQAKAEGRNRVVAAPAPNGGGSLRDWAATLLR